MKGSLKCCLCNCNESITHLLFDCHRAKEIGKIVYLATGLTPPKYISHMLGNWLSILITTRGVSFWWWQLYCVGLFGDAVMILFLTKPSIHHLCRLFSGAYWLRLWAQLQRKNMIKVLFRRASLTLEIVALEIANHGWKHNLRIGLDYFSFVYFPN